MTTRVVLEDIVWAAAASGMVIAFIHTWRGETRVKRRQKNTAPELAPPELRLYPACGCRDGDGCYYGREVDGWPLSIEEREALAGIEQADTTNVPEPDYRWRFPR